MGPNFTNVTLLCKPGTAPKLYRLDAGAAFDFAPDGSRSVKKFKQDYSDVKAVSDLGMPLPPTLPPPPIPPILSPSPPSRAF
jgi:hypothetical protein